MKKITLCLCMTAVFVMPALASAWDVGYKDGSVHGCAHVSTYQDELKGKGLRRLAADRFDGAVINRKAKESDREQFLKGFLAGYPVGYHDPKCKPK